MPKFFLAALTAAALFAQTPAPRVTSMTLPTDQLISEPGAAFQISDAELGSVFIAYGDTRFTDPSNTRQANPKVRRWLVERIAGEKPSAILINGDLPLNGGNASDYAIYNDESKIWRDQKIHVFQTLGNHEFGGGDAQKSLDNWWAAFPEMKNRRWYAAQLGSRVYVLAIDSDAPLTPGSDQDKWIRQQLTALPASVDFLIVTMHHPPVADIQTHIEVDHNPRPNEIAFRDLLSEMAPKMHARILVSAGHIHNYERNIVSDVTYLVSGGGGAPPYFVERTKDDQYQSIMFPNYHYVKFTLRKDRLHAEMVKLLDPEAEKSSWAVKDQFDLLVKP
jgi:hypothetical protein